jgi:hypothetical protein
MPPPSMVDGTAGLPLRPRERAGGGNPVGRARGRGGAVDWPPRLRPAAAAAPTPRPRVCWLGVGSGSSLPHQWTPVSMCCSSKLWASTSAATKSDEMVAAASRSTRRGGEQRVAARRGAEQGGGRALRGKKRRGKGRARTDSFGGGGHAPRMGERGIPAQSPGWRRAPQRVARAALGSGGTGRWRR